MDQNELLAALDLDAPVAKSDVVQAPEIITGGQPIAPTIPKSETVLNLDKWSMRRGEELVTESDDLKKVVQLAKDVADKAAGVAPGSPSKKPTGLGKPTEEEAYWHKAVADFHASAYEMTPQKAKGECVDKLRDDFMAALMDTQEFHEIRASTVLNPLAAEVATIAFAKQFHDRREEQRNAEEAAKKRGPQNAKGKADSAADAEIATMKAAAKACAAALEEVAAANEASEMCGLGNGDGTKRLDAKRLAAMHNRVKKSSRLRKIAEQAGRFRRLAQSKQRQKVGHGVDEVVGVTIGNEIAKLLPSELATLTDDDFGLDTMRRLLESQTMVYETRAMEPVGKGPIVVTVDESGSMDGEKIETAKGLALALAWIARKQRRWCVLVGFSGGTTGTQLLLPPGRNNEQELLDWLEHFFSGGTTMDVPLMELQKWWPSYVEAGMTRGKTDVIMITDAEVDVPEEFARSFNAFKKSEKIKMTAIVVEGEPGNIGVVVDDVFEVPALSTDCDAVGKVLSV